MTSIKYAVNSPFLRPWAERIGEIVINFSGLECETYFWLAQMSERPDRIPVFAQKMFSQRVELIRGYIRSHGHHAEWKAMSLATWAEGIELAKLRNRIAHNPLTFAWDDSAECGEPDYIGVAEMRGVEPPKDGPLLSKAAIAASSIQIVTVIKRLEALRLEWCQRRDNKHGHGTQVPN